MYEIRDTYGAPFCGYEAVACETWEDVEAYFEDEDAYERLQEGYVSIEEL